MTVQIFVSYARDDDLPPPGRDELNGFVTYLDEQLRFALTDLGQPRPHLWRDTRNVERGNQFEPRIEAAIEASALFMVVLSRNWLDRPWCQRELASFRRRWSGEDDDAVKRRIIVAAKHAVREILKFRRCYAARKAIAFSIWTPKAHLARSANSLAVAEFSTRGSRRAPTSWHAIFGGPQPALRAPIVNRARGAIAC